MIPIPTILRHATILVLSAISISCTTTYDAYGRPVQSVDPGAAAAGAVAAGVVGYAIGRSNDDDRHHHYHHHGYRRSHHHHGRRGHWRR